MIIKITCPVCKSSKILTTLENNKITSYECECGCCWIVPKIITKPKTLYT